MLTVLQQLLDGLGDTPVDEERRSAVFISLSEFFMKLKNVPDKWKKLVKIENLFHNIKN